jgi:hypothetical protein
MPIAPPRKTQRPAVGLFAYDKNVTKKVTELSSMEGILESQSRSPEQWEGENEHGYSEN